MCGRGRHSEKKHLPGYARLDDIEMCAVCDTDVAMAEQAASDFAIPRVYTDFNEMLAGEKPDIVSICTPNFTHKPLTVAALRAGANVHLEKPIALNAHEAQEVVEVEEASGKQVLQGMNKRFLGQTVLLQRLIAEGFFGEIYRARCGWERNSGIPGIGRWFTNKKLSGGGALIDLGAHYLDLTMELMGWPQATTVLGNTFSKFEKGSERIRRGYRSDPDGVYDVEDMATGFVRMKSGATLDFCFSWASNRDREARYVEFFGTKGGCRILDEDFHLFTQLGGAVFTLSPDKTTIPSDLDECGYFTYCIKNGKRVALTAEQGVATMKIIDALYKSAEKCREVVL